MYTSESFTQSLPLEKGHGKDSIRNILRLEDKPRTLLGHYNDIVRTSKRQKGQMRTIPGQTQDKPRTEKGLTKGRTDRKYNFAEIIPWSAPLKPKKQYRSNVCVVMALHHKFTANFTSTKAVVSLLLCCVPVHTLHYDDI